MQKYLRTLSARLLVPGYVFFFLSIYYTHRAFIPFFAKPARARIIYIYITHTYI